MTHQCSKNQPVVACRCVSLRVVVLIEASPSDDEPMTIVEKEEIGRGKCGVLDKYTLRYLNTIIQYRTGNRRRKLKGARDKGNALLIAAQGFQKSEEG
uniref:Uncharacterized protein n=1 Tax=Pristionchus pacificus TaxID=54126 RepID=A0A2A6B5Y7_PRIPA|eukprot:PDM61271.1 hypothetical protein PRIPAC_50713 [Pristionchus pacificus]